MKKIIALFVVVVLAAAAWSGAWVWGAGQIREQIAMLADNDGEIDPKITCATTNVSGFPFRFDIECTEATLIQQDTTLTVAGVRATVLAYHPTQVVFSTLAPLTVADAFSGASYRIDYAANEGSARLTNDDAFKGFTGEGWRIGRISVVADGVNWVDTIIGDTPVMSAGHAEIQIIDIPELHDTTAGTAALAGYATLQDTTATAYGIQEGDASLELEVTKLPDDIRDYAGDTLLSLWEQNGGMLKLVSLKGTSGSDFVESTGTMTLASGARVDGTVTVRSKGLIERLGTAMPEELKLLILGQQAADGSYSQTLNIKAGIVFVGLVPVAMIPPLMQ